MVDATLFASTPAQGRSCGTCTLCCKVFDVPVLEKPAGQWCSHCQPGRGCGIHETRPQYCRSFHCLWMTSTWLGPEWKPEKSKMVLTVDPSAHILGVQVDPGAASAWKREPYYGQLKAWAAAGARERRFVVVYLNKSATVILPDRDVPLGVLEPGDRLVPRERMTPRGVVLDVEKVSAAA